MSLFLIHWDEKKIPSVLPNSVRNDGRSKIQEGYKSF